THRNVENVYLSLYQVSTFDMITQLGLNQYYNLASSYAPRQENLVRSWTIPNVAPVNVLRYELLDLGNPDQGVQNDTPRISSSSECPGAMPPHVKVGDVATVITEPDPLRARSFPPDGEIVDLLYKDYAFKVVDGPICSNNILWWGIELREGGTAWVAEGLNNEYFFDVTTSGPNVPTPPPLSTVELNGGALPAGIYLLSASAPEVQSYNGSSEQRHFMVVGTANIVMKAGIDEVTVWATDVRSGKPLAGVPISLYGISDVTLAQNTDFSGVTRFEIPRRSDLYTALTAVLDDGKNFGVGFTEWSDGIDPWRFNVNYDYYPHLYTTYMYTDRPIYRPGQKMYFRGVVRQRDDINYTVPKLETVPIEIMNNEGQTVFTDTVTLTPYGTFSGIFDLAADAGVGFYNLNVKLPGTGQYSQEGGGIGFTVAEYRLPEYQVNLTPEKPQVIQGDTIKVTVDSKFFFGGPVANADVSYTVSSSGYYFNYTGAGNYSFYDFSRDDGTSRSLPYYYYYDPFYGDTVSTGTGTTDGNGQLVIEVPATLLTANRSSTWTIEATVSDNTGQSVSGRTTVVVHQAGVYVGVGPEKYVGVAGDAQTVNIIAVDLDSNPVPNQSVKVDVVERRWSSVQKLDNDTGQITYDFE
ncbi:MAG TPA: MG2 domain-containing protein, partial [Phototrophicaceae bacterium]|nr:MG2 domain-containing protein [Phototrophicaceae bacterium]